MNEYLLTEHNSRNIAIECIMGKGSTDRDSKSEDNAARLAAALLKQYGFGIDRLFTHQHWYSRKNCPAYILPHWNDFKKKVEGYTVFDANGTAKFTKQKDYTAIEKEVIQGMWGNGAERKADSQLKVMTIMR